MALTTRTRMTKNKQPQARLERWVFYKTGLILQKLDQSAKAKLKAGYREARRCVRPSTKETK